LAVFCNSQKKKESEEEHEGSNTHHHQNSTKEEGKKKMKRKPWLSSRSKMQWQQQSISNVQCPTKRRKRKMKERKKTNESILRQNK